MFVTIKWNSRYSAREWVVMVRALVVQRHTEYIAQRGMRQTRATLWKRFDETHHWDSAAEEWVPNEDR